MIPGYGDEATWPTFSGAHGDPRESVAPGDEIDQALNLLTEISGQIERARTAVFCRDLATYRLAMCNVLELAASVF